MMLGWRRRLDDISFFSPLAAEAPAADAIYLPGDYPELHAGRGSTRLKVFARRHARCGGARHVHLHPDNAPKFISLARQAGLANTRVVITR